MPFLMSFAFNTVDSRRLGNSRRKSAMSPRCCLPHEGMKVCFETIIVERNSLWHYTSVTSFYYADTMRQQVTALSILALTQILGWGVVSVLPVIAQAVAEELETSLPTAFLGSSVMFVAMAIVAPLAGRGFRRFGTQRVMSIGAGVVGLGLGAVALSPDLPFYWAAWALTGLGAAMFLTTSAYAYLAEYAGHRARGFIGMLMLATGLAGSVFLPLTAFLDHLVGWRDTLAIYAVLMICFVGPGIWFGLPATEGAPTATGIQGERRMGRVFFFLVAAITLNSFVTFGVEAVGIELMRAMGMTMGGAVAVASLLGAFKVGGRCIDLLGGKKWDGLSTALVCGAMIPFGLGVIWIGGAGIVSVTGYLVLFGIGSGAFAVARATMPLVFYDTSNYAAAMATIALPMNLINALAAPVLAMLLGYMGPEAVFAVLGVLGLTAFLLLLQLNRMRPRRAVIS